MSEAKKLRSHYPEREQHFAVVNLPDSFSEYERKEITQIYLPTSQNRDTLDFVKNNKLLRDQRRALKHLGELMEISKRKKKGSNGKAEEQAKQFRLRRVQGAGGQLHYFLCLKGLNVSDHPQDFIEKDEIEIRVSVELLQPKWKKYFNQIDQAEDCGLSFIRKTRFSRTVQNEKHKRPCSTIEIDFFHNLDPNNSEFIFVLGEAEIHSFQRFFNTRIREIVENFGELANHISSGKLARISHKLHINGKLSKNEELIWRSIQTWRQSESHKKIRRRFAELFPNGTKKK